MRVLEKHYGTEEHHVTLYNVPDFIDWYLEGSRELSVSKGNLKPLLWFAAVNGILDLDTPTGEFYVFGMKLLPV